MKKKFSRAALLLFSLALLLTGCKPAGPTYTVDSKIPSDRPAPECGAEYVDYVLPWYVNGVEQSQKNKTMDFYFMSVNNYPGLKSDEYFGDSTMIFFPDGTTMLIDTGDSMYAPLLVQNLKYLGVETIDYLVFSHPHSDHSFAAFSEDGVFANFKVNNVCWNGALNNGWSDQQRITHYAEKYGCKEIIWKGGDALDIGDVHLEILAPNFEVKDQLFKGDPAVNSTSLVMRFDYGETSALFTGDLYEADEVKVIGECGEKLDVDLLKIPHHARSTSSSKGFGAATTPQIAVGMGTTTVSGGIYYSYASQGAHVYLEGLDGYVHVTSNGKFLSAVASHERNSDQFSHYETMAK